MLFLKLEDSFDSIIEAKRHLPLAHRTVGYTTKREVLPCSSFNTFAELYPLTCSHYAYSLVTRTALSDNCSNICSSSCCPRVLAPPTSHWLTACASTCKCKDPLSLSQVWQPFMSINGRIINRKLKSIYTFWGHQIPFMWYTRLRSCNTLSIELNDDNMPLHVSQESDNISF